jgi:hypothetical protein
LWSVGEAIHAALGSSRSAHSAEDYRRLIQAVVGQLDERAMATAIAAGRAMKFDQAVAYALAG